MKRILVIFGTRPEAIKMAPIVHAIEKENYFEMKVCVTGQHRDMLDQVLNAFSIIPDFDLNIMKSKQSLSHVTTEILNKVSEVISDYQPDLVLVHGDTTTTFSASLAAFYHKVKVGHVEAGLRTNNIYSPWPEEANRKLTSAITQFHFAPTLKAKENLLAENVMSENIIVTGNTVIDSLLYMKSLIEGTTQPEIEEKKRKILITCHRRENFGDGFLGICEALKVLAASRHDVEFIFPVHPNPNIKNVVLELLSDISNITLTEPMDYVEFVKTMMESHVILTDSGGIQEEAPSLGKPVLVLRDTTERPEAVEAGTVKLIGVTKENIIREVNNLLDNEAEYRKMSLANNPFGDGFSANKIIDFLKERL